MLKIHRKIQAATSGKAHPGLAFGTNFAGGMAFFCFIGYRMDLKFESEPLWMVVGAFLGLGYGAYELWKVILWINRREAQREQEVENAED